MSRESPKFQATGFVLHTLPRGGDASLRKGFQPSSVKWLPPLVSIGYYSPVSKFRDGTHYSTQSCLPPLGQVRLCCINIKIQSPGSALLSLWIVIVLRG